jgi:hypothetical protein
MLKPPPISKPINGPIILVSQPPTTAPKIPIIIFVISPPLCFLSIKSAIKPIIAPKNIKV